MEPEKNDKGVKGLQWDDSLSLGVKSIDDQHKELIKLVNCVLAAIMRKDGEKAVNKVLSRLHEYTVFHFNSEEEYMKEIGYPSLAEHEEEHKKLKRQVKRFQYHNFVKIGVSLSDLKALLSDWLLTHVLESDMKIRDYKRSQAGA